MTTTAKLAVDYATATAELPGRLPVNFHTPATTSHPDNYLARVRAIVPGALHDTQTALMLAVSRSHRPTASDRYFLQGVAGVVTITYLDGDRYEVVAWSTHVEEVASALSSTILDEVHPRVAGAIVAALLVERFIDA